MSNHNPSAECGVKSCGGVDTEPSSDGPAAGVVNSNNVTTKFIVTGMDCSDEINAIKNALQHPDIVSVEANIMTSTVLVNHLPSLSDDFVKKKIESTGVKVSDAEAPDSPLLNKRQSLIVGISGILIGIGFVLPGIVDLNIASEILWGFSTFLSGSLVFPKAWRAIKQRQLDMNVLMTVAVVGAFLIKQYSEAATVVFLFSLAELLEAFSVARARKAIREVLALTPAKAALIKSDGTTIEVLLEDLKIDDLILVKTGDRIPIDGQIAKGSTFVNQAPLTGESFPVEKTVGDKVFAGTINDIGAVEVRAKSTFQNSKISQIINLIEGAQSAKAPSERFVDSFAKIYTPAVFFIAVLTFMIPPLLWGASWNDWFYRALVLLVIACPCALVISTPVSIVSGLTAMARRGVLVKGGIFLEALGRIRAIALDKTGTITEGKPKVQKIILVDSVDEKSILEIAASIEKLSSHPLAQAIVERAKELNISIKEATDFKTVVGRGAEAKIDEHQYFLGNHEFAHELGVCGEKLESLLSDLESEALSVVVVGHKPHSNCKGEVLGIIALGDTIRANAKMAVAALHKVGIEKVIMLSGDNQKTASAIALKAGIDEALGDLLPEDKVAQIKNLVEKYQTVAMIGDGINDAPALAFASVGIAMGGIGTDTAIETADVTLMQDNLDHVALAIQMGKRALSVIRFNIGFALLTKVIFLALAMIGYSNLWMAVLADTGASIFVTLNALRLIRKV